MGRVIGCHVSNFSNSCMASSLLQEESSFLYVTREILYFRIIKCIRLHVYIPTGRRPALNSRVHLTVRYAYKVLKVLLVPVRKISQYKTIEVKYNIYKRDFVIACHCGCGCTRHIELIILAQEPCLNSTALLRYG